jgi:DNA-binding FrmR family transcriptional regulator
MSIKVRLKKLEKTAGEAAGPEPPWSPPEVYDRLREDAQDQIARDLKIGEEPLYWIDDAGIIRAADDGSFVRHLGDYIQAIDREMRRLGREIVEDRASMTLEEIQQAGAEDKEQREALSKLSLDEAIAFLGAEIALDRAYRGRGRGG